MIIKFIRVPSHQFHQYPPLDLWGQHDPGEIEKNDCLQCYYNFFFILSTVGQAIPLKLHISNYKYA